jgi:hypothetical protein
MSAINRPHLRRPDVVVTSGTDYSTAIDFRNVSAGCLVAAAGFGNASVTIEWNGNSHLDKPDNSDTWYALKDPDNAAVAAATVNATTADYMELPATAFGKPWLRIKLGGNAAATKTINVHAVG